MDYLYNVRTNGVILNPAKLQFSSLEVDFAGFRVTAAEIRSLPKYLDAISAFPTPVSITDIRAWFGLVNQVARYCRITDLMAPFKTLLSPKTKFRWDVELDEAFRKSKAAIIQEVRDGVEIFESQHARRASTQTGPPQVSATGCTSSIASARHSLPAAALTAGGSPWSAPGSSATQSSVTPLSRAKPSPSHGLSRTAGSSRWDAEIW